MNTPSFSQFAADAACIKESGRWRALNERILQMASDCETEDAWYVQLFGQLCYQVFWEYSSLRQAYGEKQSGDATLLAWRSRNLLELSVWAAFFASSKDNAHRLYEDAGRDAHELLRAFETWGQANSQSSAWLNPLANGKDDLAARAANEGITTLNERYMRVEDAASKCGIADHYRIMSKVLSKFVHPTALQILGVVDDSKHELQRDSFFGLGCLFFVGAFSTMENLVVR